MKLAVPFLAITAAILLIGTETIQTFLVEATNAKWFTAYLIPRVAFTALLLTLAVCVYKSVRLKAAFRVLISLAIIGSGISLFFLKNTPYKVDWNKFGSSVSEDPDAVPFEGYFEKSNPEFEGIACLALVGCDYCHNTIDDLIKMKVRKPKLDVAIFLFAIDSSEIELVKNQIGDVDISVQNAPDPNVSFRITYGNFPTLLYIKQGQAVHRWYFSQFGFPAKDLVESMSL